ncbi:uncharacterized protein [Musca autumnalis]|uniref:uncharacterized protein n=1 Tax=Musca autumnalis TaxID=221902 RepID=UPI003CEE5FC6
MRLRRQKQIVYLVIFTLLICRSEAVDDEKQNTNKQIPSAKTDENTNTAKEQQLPTKTVKKELKPSTLLDTNQQPQPLPDVAGNADKFLTKSNDSIDNKKEQQATTQNADKTADVVNDSNTNQTTSTNTTDKKSPAIVPISSSSSTSSASVAPTADASSSNVFYHQEETILRDNEEISDSLKTGFYFFAALSLSAILFLVFKVYRLRLSRAERKYGVQGDRSTQELTPLPISIEDGHSDDEDQTVFEINRQNIRIL